MNAVGIDVSKGNSTVAVVCPLGKILLKPFPVRHTPLDLERLARSLKTLDGQTRVIMEHTGRYYEPIARFLHDAGLFVCAVNPLLIREYGNNSLRRVKTDKADSLKIARYGLDYWTELRQYVPMDTIRYQLKTLNRQYCLYSKTKVALANNLIALLDQTFPGANAYFESPARQDGSQKWVDFVLTFWHVDCVRCLSNAAFAQRYQKWCRKHGYNFSAASATRIHSDAKEMIPMLPKDPQSKLLIQQAATQLLAVSRTLELVRSQMQHLAEQLPEYPVVMAMYGVGPSIGPQLMAEIGDLRRFSKKQALAAFAGVDPEPNQSGKKESKSNKSSKRGSPQLRSTLFILMSILLRKAPKGDPVFEFLNKKRSEGKPYYVYMTAGANKFLRIYYGKVRDHLASLETTR